MWIGENLAGFWSPPERSAEHILQLLAATLQSPVWIRLRALAAASPGRLKTIELGCGLGKLSMLLCLLGHEVTFLDSNPDALRQVGKFLNEAGVPHRLVHGDLLHPDEDLLGQHDLSFSVGTVEHFVGEAARQQAVSIHRDVLKPGGGTLIAVPNYFGLFYRPVFAVRRTLGFWPKEIPEIPYSVFELRRLGRRAGLQHIEAGGLAPLVQDFRDWVLPNVRSLARKLARRSPAPQLSDGCSTLQEIAEKAGARPEIPRPFPGQALSAGIFMQARRPL